MHIHHFTLLHIARLIERELKGGVLVEAFTQEKDQVVLGLASEKHELWLRVTCAPPLPHLWPVRQFHKAKRNVFDLFPEVRGKILTGAEAIAWDRVIVLHFEEGWDLVLKMHGVQSNVLLMRQGVVQSIFRNSLEADWDYQASPGSFSTDWKNEWQGWEEEDTGKKLRLISPVLERNFAHRTNRLMEGGRDFETAVSECLEEAGNGKYYLLQEAKKIRFLLLDPDHPKTLPFTDLEKALSVFFRSFFLYNSYARHFHQADRLLKKHLKRYNGQLDSFYKSIDQIENERPPEEIGHLIMANLHALKQGMEVAELHDFYQDKPIKIKLRPELNPQQNAARYYQKQKKHRSRIKHLEIQIERLEEEKAVFSAALEAFSELLPPDELILTEKGFDYGNSKSMNAFVKTYMRLLEAGKPHLAEKKHPFLEFRRKGFVILVGKNARQNDSLTFQFSKKNDLWLHARDVTGSHVIIRNSNNATIPNDVLEYAAGLAAHFSKRKREKLVPVQYVERKHVRKVRNGAPGQVIVNREKVVMVEPVEV